MARRPKVMGLFGRIWDKMMGSQVKDNRACPGAFCFFFFRVPLQQRTKTELSTAQRTERLSGVQLSARGVGHWVPWLQAICQWQHGGGPLQMPVFDTKKQKKIHHEASKQHQNNNKTTKNNSFMVENEWTCLKTTSCVFEILGWLPVWRFILKYWLETWNHQRDYIMIWTYNIY